MKGKAIVPLVLGLVVGLLAVKFGVDAVRSAQGSNQMGEKITAVRAKQDIAAFQKITPDLVELFQTSDPQFAPDSERIPKLEDVVGRVTGKSIPLHAPVLRSMLAPAGTLAGMVGRIPSGFRAVAVKIDEASSVSYHLKPGVWVDVTVVMDVMNGRRGRKDTISEVILQRVQVAAVGKGADAESPGAKSGRPAKSATLFVPEADVPKLHLAGTRGKLSLSMRGEDEIVTKAPPKATDSDIMGLVAPDDPKPQLEPTMTQVADVTPVEVLAPFEVTIHRGIGANNAQRITFESKKSMRIVESTVGLPTRASSVLRSSRGVGTRRASESDYNPARSKSRRSGTTDNTFDSGH